MPIEHTRLRLPSGVRSVGVLVALHCTVLGCKSAEPQPDFSSLSSTLWVKTASEYAASAEQAYYLGERQLTAAIKDAKWTADIEQEKAGGYESRPPAVILDVDETVLNNIQFQARTLSKRIFDPTYRYNFQEEWDAWTREKAASAVPGALAFCRFASERGVSLFYVTNRSESAAADTLENLKALGFPTIPGCVLARQGGSPPEKSARRAAIAKNYRIVLLVGDDLNDFADGTKGVSTAERNYVYAEQRSRLGSRWIVLPNPVYGGWLEALGPSPVNCLVND